MFNTEFAKLGDWLYIKSLGNAPQGVENVHTLCAGKPESDDRGNNMFRA